MKKAISIGILTCCLFLAFQSVSKAQVKGQTKIGAGILYGDSPQAVGVQVNGTYGITQKVELAPDISVYFPGSHDGFWAVNLNGHYVFANDVLYDVYGLAGLNIATCKGYSATCNGYNEHDTHLGINLGVGSEYHLDKLSIFGELKYVVSDFNQVVIGVGVRYAIPTGSQ